MTDDKIMELAIQEGRREWKEYTFKAIDLTTCLYDFGKTLMKKIDEEREADRKLGT